MPSGFSVVASLTVLVFTFDFALDFLPESSILKILSIALLLGLGHYLLVELPKPSFVVHTSGALLITGASSGIGLHAAIEIAAKKGFTVFAGVLNSSESEAVLRECASKHGTTACKKLIPVVLDVTKQATIDSSFEKVSKWVEENNQPFIGLVNNAGLLHAGVVEFTPVSKFREGNLFISTYVSKTYIFHYTNYTP